jgi:preprotein translocase subunit SecG
MSTLFLILIVLCSVMLGLIILIQNPKGGGLAGNIAGFSNQFMGVKQTTDVLEKGTWIFASIIGVLCITSTLFMKGSSGGSIIKDLPVNQQQSVPVNPPSQSNSTPASPGQTAPAQP